MSNTRLSKVIGRTPADDLAPVCFPRQAAGLSIWQNLVTLGRHQPVANRFAWIDNARFRFEASVAARSSPLLTGLRLLEASR